MKQIGLLFHITGWLLLPVVGALGESSLELMFISGVISLSLLAYGGSVAGLFMTRNNKGNVIRLQTVWHGGKTGRSHHKSAV